MDRIVLHNGDGMTEDLGLHPLWGIRRTYELDLDNILHRKWLLRQQHDLGDVMESHKIINVESSEEFDAVRHVPTDNGG
jgi:hypothetical protein